MVGDDNGGTCVSMPVLYTAVARRLDYPVYMVTANAHVFCRWDEPRDRFNIEATNQGMNSFEDDYYMTWPKPITKAQVEKGWFLRSLNNAESFATFLAARGHCLEDNSEASKARVAYAMAAEKNPSVPIYRGFLAQTMGLRQQVATQPRRRTGPGMPPSATASYSPNPRPWSPTVPGAQQNSVFKPNDPFRAFLALLVSMIRQVSRTRLRSVSGINLDKQGISAWLRSNWRLASSFWRFSGSQQKRPRPTTPRTLGGS